MDNDKLARFITGLGRFNNYGSTVAQTKKALETGCTSHLRQENDDAVIFVDCLKAINEVMNQEFSVASIIAINAQFDGDSNEQPQNPGYLRDGHEFPHCDIIMVPLWPGEEEMVVHRPPIKVEEQDLEKIINEWKNSKKDETESWEMFAKIACLQPFQDGNKRTALIATNHALGALKSQDYILPPSGYHFNEFMNNLLQYYYHSKDDGHDDALKRFANFATTHGKIRQS